MRKFKLVYLLIIAIMVVSVAFSMTACNDKFSLYYDKESDFGLFFYGDDHNIDSVDMQRSSTDMDVKYFDPEKPTVIWVHGWEDKGFNSGDNELKVSSDAQSRGVEEYSYVAQLKAKGYNVATFQYQSIDNKNAIAYDLGKIFTSTFVKIKDREYSMAYLMASELCLNIGETYKKEITYVGHSCGSFVSLGINYYVNYFLDNGVIKNKNLLASRITLADPYFNTLGDVTEGDEVYLIKKGFLNTKIGLKNEKIPKTKMEFCANIMDTLSSSDVAFDVYLGMSLASSSFRKVDESILNKCLVVDMVGLREKYTDFSIHVLTRDWVFMSLIENKIADKENTTNSIKNLAGRWYEQTNSVLDIQTEKLIEIK